MRLVAVTRIMNEDDIVEAFVRHHQPMVDHHLFLDNGSIDRTVEILKALQDEGVPLTVLQNKAPFYAEVRYNTALYNIAARNIGADWVVFLDADEFIDSRRAVGGLRARVTALPADAYCLALPTINYVDAREDDSADLLVPRRMRRREPRASRENTKVVVRGSLAGVIEIEGGQHSATYQGTAIPAVVDDMLLLAHYPRRGPYQILWKSILGHLKVLASGKTEIEKQRNYHYADPFSFARDTPERLLREAAWMTPTHDEHDLVLDPIQYQGVTLRYTMAMDASMKAIRVLLSYGEQLAREYGVLIDGDDETRRRAEAVASLWTKLF